MHLHADAAALLAYSEPFDHCSISTHILALQIIQKAPPLADHPEKSAARMMILCVNLEMIRQVIDFFA